MFLISIIHSQTSNPGVLFFSLNRSLGPMRPLARVALMKIPERGKTWRGRPRPKGTAKGGFPVRACICNASLLGWKLLQSDGERPAK